MHITVKKQRPFILLLVLLVTAVLLASCGHRHSYSHGEIVAPTCTTEGEEIYSCGCGEIYEKRVIPIDVNNHKVGDNGVCELCQMVMLEYSSYGDGTCDITWAHPSIAGDIVIPDKAPHGDTVVCIGYEVFKGRSSLTSITIPEGVTSIGDYAFYGCSSLTSITIPESVTSIGERAFSNCSSLAEITIPEGVTSIGEYTFHGCSSLTSITIPEGVTSIGKSAFGGCYSLESISLSFESIGYLEYIFNESSFHSGSYVPESLKTVVITGNEIPEEAFYRCSSLTSIIIPESVTSIGEYAFYGCSSLAEITIPEGVTSIGEGAFSGCSSLTSITIPEGVTSIEGYAFSGCSSLTSITIPEGVTSIGEYAFYGCSSLTSITIPESVTSIGSSAFSGCSSLTSITIPEGVTSIGGIAFSGCSSLTSIIIPESVTSIGRSAFFRCYSLESISLALESIGSSNQYLGYIFGADSYDSSKQYVPQSLKTVVVTGNEIPDYAFFECSSITSVTIPEGVTSIGAAAFDTCTGLTEINIPESVTSIGSSAFYGCTGLTEINIPESVTSIGYGAFSGCSSLTSITIPEGVTSIEWKTFYGCSSLTNITIPEGVTSIGAAAFDTCTGLTEINIPESVTSIGSSAFYGCTGLTEINIPESVTSIGSSAFYGCTGLTEITIPEGVTSIGSSAFSGCSSLESISLSLESIGSSNPYLEYIFGDSSYSHSGSYVPESLKTVIIVAGDGISYRAFYGCSSLTNITIPESVTSIGEYAFYGCTGLTEITIPEGVTSIGRSAFEGCNSLESITLPLSYSAYYSYLDHFGYIFGYSVETGESSISSDCHTYRKYTRYQNYSEYTYYDCYTFNIPDGLKTVTVLSGNTSFRNCRNIENIILSDGVSSIGEEAFYNCIALTSLVIPEGVTSIGKGAFNYCSSLTSVTIPEEVSSVGENAFYGCYLLAEVINHSQLSITAGSDDFGGVAKYAIEVHSGNSKIKEVDGYIFYIYNGTPYYVLRTDSTKDLLPESYNGYEYAIKSYAFYNNGKIDKLVIPDRVFYIDEYAFSRCYNLTSIKVNARVYGYDSLEIGENAFSSCSNLTSLSLEGVSVIGKKAFYNCNALTVVSIPSNVTSLGCGVFGNCSKIETIKLPFVGGSADTSENYWFGYIFGATSYSGNTSAIPASLKTVEITAASGIASFAFYGCDGITNISISDTVESIGVGAFKGCSALESFTIPFAGGSTTENTYFSYMFGTENSDVPKSVKNVIVCGGTKVDFYNCAYIENITLPDTAVDVILSGCSSLKKIHIPKNVVNAYWYGTLFLDGCTSIGEVTVDSENSSLKAIDGNLYSKDGTILYYYSPAKVDATFIIPSGVTTVRANFSGCENLTELIIPKSVTSIANVRATSVTKITVLSGNEYYCSINGDLYSADGKTLLSFAKGKSEVEFAYGITTIANSAFWGAENITEIIIPDTVTTIGDGAFNYCTNLTKIVIPYSVETINGYAFYGSNNTVAYCMYNQAPSGWSSTWSMGCKSVEWGYTEE